MNDLERVYFDAAFAGAYPEFVASEREEKKPKAAKSKSASAPAAATQPAMTAGDVGLTIMDTFAGLAKGAVAQSLGVGGDIRELIDAVAAETAKNILGERIVPTTEEMQRLLPQLFPDGIQVDPRRRATASNSEKIGEFIPVAPLAAAKSAISSARRVKFGQNGKRAGVAAAAASPGTAGTPEPAK